MAPKTESEFVGGQGNEDEFQLTLSEINENHARQ
jgi:hypothetical protein